MWITKYDSARRYYYIISTKKLLIRVLVDLFEYVDVVYMCFINNKIIIPYTVNTLFKKRYVTKLLNLQFYNHILNVQYKLTITNYFTAYISYLSNYNIVERNRSKYTYINVCVP